MVRSSLLIAGLDIATQTGGAVGYADGKPKAWTWALSKAGKSRPARLALLRDYCDRFFVETRLDALFYERGLSLAAAMEIGMSEDTMALLRGAIGVVEACAFKAGIKRIEAVGVQEARRHLLGAGKIPKGQGKKLVRERCQMLGWKTENEDESDACAIFALGVGLTSPAMAALSTPLFAGR